MLAAILYIAGIILWLAGYRVAALAVGVLAYSVLQGGEAYEKIFGNSCRVVGNRDCSGVTSSSGNIFTFASENIRKDFLD